MFDGLKIFPGMETDIAEGGHVLSIGPMEAILELNHRLELHKAKGSFLPCGRAVGTVRRVPRAGRRRTSFPGRRAYPGSAAHSVEAF